jgi:hypothetical protein
VAAQREQDKAVKRTEEEHEQYDESQRLREEEQRWREEEWQSQVEAETLKLGNREEAVAQMEELCAQEAEEIETARQQHKKRVVEDRSALEALEASLGKLRGELVDLEADLEVREASLKKRTEEKKGDMRKQQEERTEAGATQRDLLASVKAQLAECQAELIEARKGKMATAEQQGVDAGDLEGSVAEPASIHVLKRALASQRKFYDDKVLLLETEVARQREESTEIMTIQGELGKLDLKTNPIEKVDGEDGEDAVDARVQALKDLSARVCSYVAVLNRQLATCRTERQRQAEWEVRRTELEQCEARLSLLLEAETHAEGGSAHKKPDKDTLYQSALEKRVAVVAAAEDKGGVAAVYDFGEWAGSGSPPPQTETRGGGVEGASMIGRINGTALSQIPKYKSKAST